MIQVSEAYRKACESPTRVSYFSVKYGLYDKQAKTKISNVVSEKQLFSNISETYDEIKSHTLNYISCEPNRVKLDDTFAFVQDKTTTTNRNQKIAYWSNEMSNNLGAFSNGNPTIVYIFSSEIDFTDLTLYFQEIVSDMKIKYYLNNVVVYTKNIVNNNKLEFQTIDNTSLLTTNYFDKLELEFIKTKEPYRYVKFNEIDFGVYQTFRNDEIKSLDIVDEMSIDSSELSSNGCNLTIKDTKSEYDILNPYNKLNMLQERQELGVYHYLKVGNSFKEIPLGIFLLKNIYSENQELKLECYDDIYFMNQIYYGSKFYDNVECSQVFTDLFNYFGYTNDKYVIDDELQGIKLTGYISNVEMRESLRLIAEASGCVVNKTRYGITYIFKTYDSAIKLFKNDNYDNITFTKNLYNNVIDITEYNYNAISINVEELFNATLNIGTYTINFSKYPIVYSMYEDNPNLLKSDSSANYNIIELGCVSCKIEVYSNNTNVILQGKYYIESKKTQTFKKNPNVIIDEYAITKVDNHLITSSNSQDIANWKLIDRSEIKYSFDYLMTPYIECGDTCKIETKYKDLQGNIIKKSFIPTYINFTNSIKQSFEGE